MTVEFLDGAWKSKMPSGSVMIYALVDSRKKDDPRYVGQTRKPRFRLWEHKREGVGGKYPNLRNNWIRSVIRSGGDVLMRPLEIVLEADASGAESKWMCALKDAGFKLKNGTDFTNVRLLGRSALQKIARRNREAWANPEVRAKRLEALNRPDVRARNGATIKSYWENPEWREKAIAIRNSDEYKTAHRAAVNSVEYKRGQSEISKRAWSDEASRENRLVKQKEALLQPHVRAKLSKSRKEILARPGFLKSLGEKMREIGNDPEERARRSKRQKEKWADPEYRAMMRAARAAKKYSGGSHA